MRLFEITRNVIHIETEWCNNKKLSKFKYGDYKDLYTQFEEKIYVTCENKENIILDYDNKEFDCCGKRIVKIIISYTDIKDITKNIKFYPDESNDLKWFFEVDGEKFKFQYEEWGCYEITNCITGETPEWALRFPDSVFPKTKDTNEYYAVYNIDNNYKLYWGEDPYSDTAEYAIYNENNHYIINNFNLTYNEFMDMINSYK